MIPNGFPGKTALEISGFKDILDYDMVSKYRYDPREASFYDTKGLFLTGQPSIHGLMGEIERDSEYKPGIRCASITDALNIQEGLSSIILGSIYFDKVETGGPRQVGARLKTLGPEPQTMKRRRFGDLGYGDIDFDPSEPEGGYNSTPPLINGDKLRKLQHAYPDRDVSAFFGNLRNQTNEAMPYFRLTKNMYWEVFNGQKTGAVYIDCFLGIKTRFFDENEEPIIKEILTPGEVPEGPGMDPHTDYQGYLYHPPIIFYQEYFATGYPIMKQKSYYLFTGMQPFYERYYKFKEGNYTKVTHTKKMTFRDIQFELLYYRYEAGDADFDKNDVIWDYIESVG